MKFHGIDMRGKFLVQEVASLPAWTSADKRRIVYVTDQDKIYNGGDSGWISLTGENIDTSFTNEGTLSKSNIYLIDTTSSTLSGYLDTSVADGDTITIVDEAGKFSTNNMTVMTVGTSGPSNEINGSTDNYICSTNYGIYKFIYSETYGWIVDVGGATSSSGGVSYIELKPEDMTYDDTSGAITSDDLWGVIPCINFNQDIDGAVWMTCKAPDNFDYEKDLKIKMIYNLGTETTGNVYLEGKSYVVENGGNTNETSEKTSGNETITASSSNKGYLNELELPNFTISASDMSDPLYFSFYILRDADNVLDTYDGTLQVVSFIIYQD